MIKLREAFEKGSSHVLEASQWNQSEAAKILKVIVILHPEARQFGILIRIAEPTA